MAGRAGHATETTTVQSTQSADGSARSTVTKTERLVQSSKGWVRGLCQPFGGLAESFPSALPPQLLCHSLPVRSLAYLCWEQECVSELSLWLAQSLPGGN